MKSFTFLSDIVFPIVVVFVCLVAAVRYLAQRPPSLSDSEVERMLAFAHPLQDTLAGEGVVLEFVDFQCPVCIRIAPQMQELATRFASEVTVYLYPLPLSTLHADALPAAIAAECAAAQGRFGPYVEGLYEARGLLGEERLRDIASKARIPDERAFEACQKSDLVRAKILEAVDLATRAEIPGTPTIALDGRVITTGPTGLELALVRSRSSR